MPDSPLSDPRISNKTPKDWAQQLQERVQGHALWHASPVAEGGGSVGDCGYINGGRFIKLFNIFDAHNVVGIDPHLYRLTAADIRSESKENVFPLSYSSRIRTIDLGMNLQTGPLQLPPPINATLSATVLSERESMAFLAFCGPTTTSSWYDKTRLLENYMIAQYARILRHFGTEHPVELNKLLIIQGTKTAASWLGGLASGHQSGLRGESGVGGIGASGRILSLEENGWSVTHGNRYWDSDRMAGSEPCIVVKPIKMRVKERVISRLSTFVGIPGGRFQQRPAVADSAQIRSNRASGNFIGASLRPRDDVYYYPSTAHGRSRSNSQGRMSDSEQSDEPLLDDQTDLLDELLDFVLDSRPNAKSAIGSWDVIERFVKIYGEFPENWQAKNIITAVVEECQYNILRVIGVQLRTLQPIVYTARTTDKVAVQPSQPLGAFFAEAKLAPSDPPSERSLSMRHGPRPSLPDHVSLNSCPSKTTLADEPEPVPALADEGKPSSWLAKTQRLIGDVTLESFSDAFYGARVRSGHPHRGDPARRRISDRHGKQSGGSDSETPRGQYARIPHVIPAFEPASITPSLRGSVESKLANLGIRDAADATGPKANFADSYDHLDAKGRGALGSPRPVVPSQRVSLTVDPPVLREGKALPRQPRGRETRLLTPNEPTAVPRLPRVQPRARKSAAPADLPPQTMPGAFDGEASVVPTLAAAWKVPVAARKSNTTSERERVD